MQRRRSFLSSLGLAAAFSAAPAVAPAADAAPLVETAGSSSSSSSSSAPAPSPAAVEHDPSRLAGYAFAYLSLGMDGSDYVLVPGDMRAGEAIAARAGAACHLLPWRTLHCAMRVHRGALLPADREWLAARMIDAAAWLTGYWSLQDPAAIPCLESPDLPAGFDQQIGRRECVRFAREWDIERDSGIWRWDIRYSIALPEGVDEVQVRQTSPAVTLAHGTVLQVDREQDRILYEIKS